jgi:hypothetical protein
MDTRELRESAKLRAENERLRDALRESLRLISEVYSEFVNHRYIEAGGYLPTDGSQDTRWMREAAALLVESTQPAPDQKGKL